MSEAQNIKAGITPVGKVQTVTMKENRQNVDFTIVVPVYFNEESLVDLYQELERDVFLRLPSYVGEIIFVDDGSGDRSFAMLAEIQTMHPARIRVIKLSRNFGQVNAIWCGLTHARGQATVVISADGQDPADLAAVMISQVVERGKEVVICRRVDRVESRWRKLTSCGFYSLMRKICFSNMPRGGFDYFTLGCKARQALLGNYQKHGFLQGQILRLGFDPYMMDYQRRARKYGKSRWSFSRKLTYLIDGVIGYSYIPLRLMSLIGIIMSLAGFVYALIVLVSRMVSGNIVYGWAPIMIVILVLGGVQMSMLGSTLR